MANTVYIYQWVHSEEYVVEIRGYGITTDDRLICLTISDFLPHIYVLSQDNRLDTSRCVKYAVVERENLYNFHQGKHLFYKMHFKTKATIAQFIRDYNLDGIAHEQNASPLLQFLTQRRLPQVGWVKFDGQLEDDPGNCDAVYDVAWDRIWGVDGPYLELLACAFDFEVHSTIPGAMPSNKPGDEIFQISVVFSDGEQYLLSLKGTDYSADVIQFETEAGLLDAFCKLLAHKRPLLLYGYNILGFDLHYLIQRSSRLFQLENVLELGYGPRLAEVKTVQWTSTAFGDQEFTFVNWEGIVILDLYPIIKRDYKFYNYRLETVAQELLGRGKDPITVKDIIAAYETKRMRRVGEYCLKDSQLCLDLAEKMSTWVGLVQMANVCHVQPMTLYLQGQQIKIFSQVYNYCHWHNIVVNTNAYKTPASMKYTGAYVMDPVPGLYSNTVPFDFSSLYPSIIITENICYSTIADKGIGDEKCNIFEWEDHIGCPHDPKVIAAAELTRQIDALESEIKALRLRRDAGSRNMRKPLQVEINKKRGLQRPLRKSRSDIKMSKTTVICEKHRFRFLKTKEKKGVIPTIIQNLLDARKKIKTQLKAETNPLNKIILDKQQLAYKVSANSMYGAMGVRTGYLPYMPGAMTITHCGRQAIKKSLKIIEEEFQGKVIYGDTDSNYVQFPHIPLEALWDHAIAVAKKVSAYFPQTMSLEFEEKIYKQFILLGKKKYVYMAWSNENETKLGHKGIVLSRRDNPKIVRDVFLGCLEEIFAKRESHTVLMFLIDRLSRLGCTRPAEDFVLTKSVGVSDGEYDEETGTVGVYKIRKPTEEIADDDWFVGRLPAHVQLARRMCKRGVRVQPGTRLEIVVLARQNATKLGDKFEEFSYFKDREWYLRLDFDYYLKSMINPIDQLLEAVFGVSLVKQVTDVIRQKTECLNLIKKRGKPRLIFVK